MSDAEEAMDGSVSGDEAEQKQSPKKQRSSPDKSYMWGAGEIIEGKRAKKSVERLDMQVPKKAEKLSIGEGSGEKLGDIPRIGFQLNKTKPDVLLPLHSLLFDRRGKISTIKKNIRLFNGFPFDSDSEQFTKKRERLQKNTKSKLLVMCSLLDLEKKGSHPELVEKILTFLMSPKSSGKRLPKKKKRSKKNLSGDDGESKKKPSKKRSSSKQKPSSTSSPKKSKAIVMDSSSDDDEEEEEEKAESGESEAGSGSGDESGAQSGSKGQSEDQSEEEEEEEEEESPKPKARAKSKKTPAKKPSSKKPAKKRSRKEASESESSREEDEPKKKKSKPAAKTKKADSSSNSKTNNNNNTTADDSSDEDEPLSKMVKKGPSDEQLKETVQSLLKEANLEELTMKQICQKVFDAHSEHDLSNKKDFIKQTVKSLIT